MNLSEITLNVRRNFANLFDEKVGVINEIIEFTNPLIISFHSYFAAVKSDGNELHNGSGIARDRDNALSKAIGECLERYCLSNMDDSRFVYTKYKSSSNKYPCVCPFKVQIYTDDELNRISFHLYDESFETIFCAAYNVTKMVYQYVPLSMIYLSSYLSFDDSKKTRIIQQGISTGAAFGIDFYETALTGIYEVIERDSMMTFWLLGQEASRILLRDLDLPQQKLVNEINRNNIKVNLFDISINEHVFVILACLNSDYHEMPATVFSGGCHHDFATAVQKTLEEVILTFGLAENLLRTDREGYSKFLNEREWIYQVTKRNDHVKFWAYHEVFDKFKSHLDFIFASTKIAAKETLMKKNKQFLDSKSAFSAVVQALARSGYELLIVDLSTLDIETLGFMTLKAIIPGYLPLHLGHQFSYTRPRRLVEIAESFYNLNFDKIKINKAPHPFP